MSSLQPELLGKRAFGYLGNNGSLASRAVRLEAPNTSKSLRRTTTTEGAKHPNMQRQQSQIDALRNRRKRRIHGDRPVEAEP